MTSHTSGPWKVYEKRLPFLIKKSVYGDEHRGEHIERVIGTEWDHPQMKGPAPVICVSIGVGNEEVESHHFVHMTAEDAQLIAAVPDLLEALEEIVSAINGNHLTEGDVNQAIAAIKKATGAA